MMLDTDALCALAAREPAIFRRLDEVSELAVSFISIAEFHFGLLGSTRPDPGFALLGQLRAMIPVLYPGAETLAHYAWIADHLKRKGRPIPQNDMWTGALARQHAIPVLSRDRHFDRIAGLERVEW